MTYNKDTPVYINKLFTKSQQLALAAEFLLQRLNEDKQDFLKIKKAERELSEKLDKYYESLGEADERQRSNHETNNHPFR